MKRRRGRNPEKCLTSQTSNFAPKSLPTAGKHKYNPSTAMSNTPHVICSPGTLSTLSLKGRLFAIRAFTGGRGGPDGSQTKGSSFAARGLSPLRLISSLMYSWILRRVLPSIWPSIGLVVVMYSSMVECGTRYLNIWAAARDVFDVVKSLVVKLLGRLGNSVVSLAGTVGNSMGTMEGRTALAICQLESMDWGPGGTRCSPLRKWESPEARGSQSSWRQREQ